MPPVFPPLTTLSPYERAPLFYPPDGWPPITDLFSMSDMEICTKPASRVAGSGVRFGRTNCMLHPAALIAAVSNQVSRSERNCCTAMKFLKAIVLPNPNPV